MHEIKELRPEDVWMDLTVEPFQDNFNDIIGESNNYRRIPSSSGCRV